MRRRRSSGSDGSQRHRRHVARLRSGAIGSLRSESGTSLTTRGCSLACRGSSILGASSGAAGRHISWAARTHEHGPSACAKTEKHRRTRGPGRDEVLAGGLVGLAAARACELDGTQLLSLRAHDPRSRARSLLSQAGNQGRGDAPANPTGPTLDAPGTPRQSPRGSRATREQARKGDFPLAPLRICAGADRR